MLMYAYIGLIELTSIVTFLIQYGLALAVCHIGTARLATVNVYSLC